MPRALPEGLYEEVVTGEVETALSGITPVRFDVVALDGADAHVALARHVARELERVLEAVPHAERPQRQAEIANDLLRVLSEQAHRGDVGDNSIAPPARRLDAVYRAAPPRRPSTPLASSTLLTRNRSEPSLGHELAAEIASADEIDILAAFITLGGVRAIREALESFARRGGRARVITTVFTGTTEVAAVDALAKLPGVDVKISYDVRRTRLHAKAWMFRRNSGLHTAYVGSANLTQTALGAGQEWMVKACAADLPHVVEKFRGTFEGLWNDSEFEPYDRDSAADRERLASALNAEGAPESHPSVLFTLRPFPFQEEILDRLDAERIVHGRHRNLVVAATGTGKTVIAAFDYLRFAGRSGLKPRLLFLAHRREILDQARETFRHVVRDASFGEMFGDGSTPARWEHVFATIQTAAGRLFESVAADHFRYVVVDECHHAPADSYKRVVPQLRPEILLGLTATPERSDGQSLLPDFDGHIGAELRLWHALERQLLTPFEYYGVSDGTDLRRLHWTRSGYRAADLAGVYTGNDARVDLVVEQLRLRVADVRGIRALAFCVSIEHAEFMARALTARGIPAVAVHGDTPDDQRDAAPGRLRTGEVSVLCACDLYNEGVDLPFVDTLLLLRPTSSATLFLQQIGRGLRLHKAKQTCLVLDFIGQHRTEFRFDAVYTALTGVPRGRLERAIDQGFPYLPSGCELQLDPVARQAVLDSLRASVANVARLTRELRDLADPSVSLARFLDESGRSLEDVYAAGGWTTLKARAGLVEKVDDETKALSERLGWLLHVDEPTRLRAWRDGLRSTTLYDRRRLAMLDFQLHHRGVLREAPQTIAYFAERPAIASELAELAASLDERVATAEDVYPVPEWPLALHRHYKRREIVAAIGFSEPGKNGITPQGGILKLPGEREILFVTLDKSASSFSPTTRYRDYAISRRLFHWETQGAASVLRESGRRYVESGKNGWTFFLFVREDPDAAYAFLGPVRYESHTGDRPIAITWALETAMPAGLFERFATLAQR